jgi:hypothetical protein
MLQLDGNADVYEMECNKMLKYNIMYSYSFKLRFTGSNIFHCL